MFVGTEKRFVCNICNASYKHSPNLSAHKKLHTGETLCPVCQKAFSRKSNAMRHLAVAHGEIYQFDRQ